MIYTLIDETNVRLTEVFDIELSQFN